MERALIVVILVVATFIFGFQFHTHVGDPNSYPLLLLL